MNIFNALRFLITPIFIGSLSGCASTLLDDKEFSAYNERQNATLVETKKNERYAAGFMARYGLDSDERRDFVSKVSSDSEYMRSSLANILIENELANQLYKELGDEVIASAMSNGVSANVAGAGAMIGAYLVVDMMLTESGKDVVGGINLPKDVEGRTLEDVQQANEYLVQYINKQVDHAASKHNMHVHKRVDHLTPANGELPNIHNTIYWLVPNKTAGSIEQPEDDHLMMRVVWMEVIDALENEVSPLLISSLGFTPKYRIPSKYFRGFNIDFLKNAEVKGDEILHVPGKIVSTVLKRNVVKSVVGLDGYLYNGDFTVGYNGGDFLAYKGKNYHVDLKLEHKWMTHELVE